MLLNNKGQAVNVPKNLNSREHPGIFAQLTEVHAPLDHRHDKMFRLDQRARVITN